MFKVLWDEFNNGKMEYLQTKCKDAKDAQEWAKLLAVGGPEKNWPQALKVRVVRMTEDEIVDWKAEQNGF